MDEYPETIIKQAVDSFVTDGRKEHLSIIFELINKPGISGSGSQQKLFALLISNGLCTKIEL